MPDTITDHLSAGQLADRAANAIHELNRRTHPTSKDLVYPADAAEIIATLAAMTGMLGQLLTQLTRWLAHQHRDGRLTLDSLSPQPDLASAMRALTSSLQHAIEQAQHTATELDTAHQHAAHLAAAQPATKRSKPQHQGPGPKFMQIGGAKTLDETQAAPAHTTIAPAGDAARSARHSRAHPYWYPLTRPCAEEIFGRCEFETPRAL